MAIITRMSLAAKILSVASLCLIILTISLFTLYSINSKKKNTIDAFVGKARTITLTVKSIRQEMEKKWEQGLFSVEMIQSFHREKNMEKILSTVPVVSAWNSAMRKADTGEYVFRVPKFQPRRTENTPDHGLDYAIEGPALQRLMNQDLTELYVIDEQINAIRYFLPVRLSENCMICHGDPATAKELWGNTDGRDPTGGKMENWKAGEIHGAFEVIQFLKTADAQRRSELFLAGGVAAAGILMALIVFFFLINRGVVSPIRLVIGGLNEGSSQVAEASGLVSDSSQILADGAKTQAVAVKEISSTLEEVSSITRQNVENAENVSHLMQNANTIIHNADESMKELTRSMSQIEAASQETSKIIKTIDEIAFQTNLLALNAAVEAAWWKKQARILHTSSPPPPK